MDRATRSELVKTVEAQKEKLQKYEAKLRDVIQAYKGVIKEKDALEASIKALTSSRQKDKDENQQSIQDPLNVSQEQPLLALLFDSEDKSANENSSDDKPNEDQIQTLTTSLFTLTQEKSKVEASYVADKKRLLTENEELTKKISEEQEQSKQKFQQLEEQVQELKSKIISQQKDREKEQTDHAVMLRELQKLLSAERIIKEQFESQLEDATAALKEKEKLVPNLSEVYEKRLKDLSAELQNVKEKLRESERKAKQPSPEFLELQKQMERLKIQNQKQINQEQRNLDESEKILQQHSMHSEERVAMLETKLSEISKVVGEYEKLKCQDQITIQKLKERVTQLDLENTALSQSQSSGNYGQDDDTSDPQVFADKILNLKDLLKSANKHSENPVKLKDLFTDEEDVTLNDCPFCDKAKEDYEQVKEEFERYKLRAQSVLKNKNTKDTGPSKEVEALRSQITDLREKVKSHHLQHEDECEKLKQKAENSHKAMINLTEKHKHDVALMEAEHRHKMNELEMEIKKQRDRTVSLLAEKDRELDFFRHQNFEANPYYPHLRNPPDSGASAELPQDLNRQKTEEEEAVSRLLNLRSLGQNDSNMLFFSQEIARKDVEINSLRKQKHQLETALRELQVTASTKEEELHDKIEGMKEEIRKCERDKSREGANLEYLKNVAYKFLITTDPQSKQQMLNAITTILQFSPQEKAVVHTQFRGWWK
ncbi:GRIP and coiled-coil domain-containing protein 1-like isoform X1 [Mytilus californianus]|uniref:GRIP and coiled-coil domain-containing protein 1-like isoform X1 n=1 Tax=Mytilus californianus TaxID=6549 RepID=UPI0022485F7A|nr:GRIP and coiled-coil domain-containing protein 1-like isoform X1 [Mytilus californianus]XP_052105860.1 GRIP and coiled-coil domain-containing protein 1-like isoform X1 [Mytilus californianus]